MAESSNPLPTATADPNYEIAYRAARRRVRRLRGWYIHALIFAAVVGAFWLMFLVAPGYTRFGWPRPLPMTLGWGLGLTVHGLFVWAGASGIGRRWEARKLEEFMQHELAARGPAHR
ncbi:MAG: 2TM domain-containing protein [Lautropia sp.]